MEENFSLDASSEVEMKEIVSTKKASTNRVSRKKETVNDTTKELHNCLQNKRVTIKYLTRKQGIWGTNPRHPLSGGMADNAVKTFVVPRLASGTFVNVLTDSEKDFLENLMGLEPNALSVYNKTNNFWDSSNDEGVNKVKLHKQDTVLNLADPEDYIRYKILLANKNFIAPSMKAVEETPKASYMFVIVSKEDEIQSAKSKMSDTMQCYKEFGKMEDNFYKLKVVLETILGKPISKDSKLEFLQAKINDCIQSNSKLFLKVVQDSLLDNKILIKKAIDNGLISTRGNYLYLRDGNIPLCESGEEPTLNIAAKYLDMPKNQEIKFTLEAKIDN